MSLLRNQRFEFRGPAALAKNFRKALVTSFFYHGFERRLHVDAPRSAEIDEFQKAEQVVTLCCEHGRDEPLLSIETEAPLAELDSVIVEGAALALVEVAGLLFAQFDAAQTREALSRLEKLFSKRLEQAAEED